MARRHRRKTNLPVTVRHAQQTRKNEKQQQQKDEQSSTENDKSFGQSSSVASPPPSTACKTQQVIARFHVLRKRLERLEREHRKLVSEQQGKNATCTPSTKTSVEQSKLEDSIASIKAEMDKLGGLHAYQRASLKGGDEKKGKGASGKWVEPYLKEEWLRRNGRGSQGKKPGKDTVAEEESPVVPRWIGGRCPGCNRLLIRPPLRTKSKDDASSSSDSAPPIEPDWKDRNKFLRILDIGALNGETYKRCKMWLKAEYIDLQPQHPSVKRQDFFERETPRWCLGGRWCSGNDGGGGAKKTTLNMGKGDAGQEQEVDVDELGDDLEESNVFDCVAMSLVLNFVGEPERRGDMLHHALKFLHPVHGGYIFLVLPLPCVTNSRYTTHQWLCQMMAESFLGSTASFKKESKMKNAGCECVAYHHAKKIAFYLFRWNGVAGGGSNSSEFRRHFDSEGRLDLIMKDSPKTLVNQGGGRNNFSVVVKRK
ncbi:hypothetical protein HK102_010106 [Quaeritorhiza haematococci]|nr:hypothetical protein HK102_010106 [Quaeritorhiza haematococci]